MSKKYRYEYETYTDGEKRIVVEEIGNFIVGKVILGRRGGRYIVARNNTYYNHACGGLGVDLFSCATGKKVTEICECEIED